MEVALLDARRLLEQRRLLHVRRVRDELPDAVLEGEVTADRAGLEQLEAVVVDVRNLAERLPRFEARVLVLALEDVDVDGGLRYSKGDRDGVGHKPKLQSLEL